MSHHHLNGCHREVHILLTSPDLTELIILLRQVPKADVRFARKIPRCTARNVKPDCMQREVALVSRNSIHMHELCIFIYCMLFIKKITPLEINFICNMAFK